MFKRNANSLKIVASKIVLKTRLPPGVHEPKKWLQFMHKYSWGKNIKNPFTWTQMEPAGNSCAR